MFVFAFELAFVYFCIFSSVEKSCGGNRDDPSCRHSANSATPGILTPELGVGEYQSNIFLVITLFFIRSMIVNRAQKKLIKVLQKFTPHVNVTNNTF